MYMHAYVYAHIKIPLYNNYTSYLKLIIIIINI